MPRKEANPNHSSQQNGQQSSDSGNADSQTEQSAVPKIKPIELEPHRRGLFEIPRISRRQEQ